MFSCCEGGKEDFVHDASSNKANTAQPQRPPYGGGGERITHKTEYAEKMKNKGLVHKQPEAFTGIGPKLL
ncbi:hypothetical protein Tco_1263201 [Tanacetum coccineum]